MSESRGNLDNLALTECELSSSASFFYPLSKMLPEETGPLCHAGYKEQLFLCSRTKNKNV